jgi:hypothetical protein
MLRPLGLSYVIHDEMLLITTPEEVYQPWLIRAYDVADMVTSHDPFGGVHYEYAGLEEAIGHHVDKNVELTDVRGGWIGHFSNGRVQLLAVRLYPGEDEETEWLLAEIRRIGRNQPAGSREPVRAAERGSKRSLPLATILPGEEAIQKALAQKGSFGFHKAPLTDVIDYLKDQFKIEIQLDRKALSDQGTGTDSAITINASDITMRTALARILTPLELSWIIQDEVLLITISDEADSRLFTKVYAADDLSDCDLPTKTDPTKDIGARMIISSDAVRTLVVTAPYAIQETIAEKLAALREKADRERDRKVR